MQDWGFSPIDSHHARLIGDELFANDDPQQQHQQQADLSSFTRGLYSPTASSPPPTDDGHPFMYSEGLLEEEEGVRRALKRVGKMREDRVTQELVSQVASNKKPTRRAAARPPLAPVDANCNGLPLCCTASAACSIAHVTWVCDDSDGSAEAPVARCKDQGTGQPRVEAAHNDHCHARKEAGHCKDHKTDTARVACSDVTL
jgi:hypothetical protein